MIGQDLAAEGAQQLHAADQRLTNAIAVEGGAYFACSKLSSMSASDFFPQFKTHQPAICGDATKAYTTEMKQDVMHPVDVVGQSGETMRAREGLLTEKAVAAIGCGISDKLGFTKLGRDLHFGEGAAAKSQGAYFASIESQLSPLRGTAKSVLEVEETNPKEVRTTAE